MLGAALGLARPGAKLVALVKPQFEAGREEVGKGGVVRDPEVHRARLRRGGGWVASQGWTVLGVTTSPITGPEGNVEFLLGAVKWLKRCCRQVVADRAYRGAWRSSSLGSASGWLSQQRLGQYLVRRGRQAVATCRPAGRSAWCGRCSTHCSGIALALILAEPPSDTPHDRAGLFFVQLALNFAWSPIFFAGE